MNLDQRIAHTLKETVQFTHQNGNHIAIEPTEATEAIKQLISEVGMEVIGKDDRDYSQDNVPNECDRKILVATSTACNELRADQRAHLKRLTQ